MTRTGIHIAAAALAAVLASPAGAAGPSTHAGAEDTRAVAPGAQGAALAEIRGAWFAKTIAGDPIAMFGPPHSEPLVSLLCDRAAREIVVERRAGADVGTPARLEVALGRGTGARAALEREIGLGSPLLSARIPASDPVFDRIGRSDERIAIDVPGLAPVSLPDDPILAGVVDACRPETS